MLRFIARVGVRIAFASVTLSSIATAWADGPIKNDPETIIIRPLPEVPRKPTRPRWLDPGRNEYCHGYEARGQAIRGKIDHAQKALTADGDTLLPEVAELLKALSEGLIGTDECPGGQLLDNAQPQTEQEETKAAAIRKALSAEIKRQAASGSKFNFEGKP